MQHTSLLSRLGSYLLPTSELDLRERFYEQLCLFSALISILVVLPTNALQNLPLYVSVVVLFFGLLSVGFYIAARRGRRYPGLFLAVLLVMMNVAWFPNAGSYGSPLFYWIIPTFYAVTFFSGRTRAVVVATVVLNAVALIGLEYTWPDSVEMFQRRQDRYIDLTTGFVVSTGTAVLMLWIVSRGYERESARLRVAVDALTRSEERFARLFQVNPDALFVFDTARRAFLEVNEGFTSLTGWSREEAIGSNGPALNLWLSEDDRRRLNELVEDNDYGTTFVCRFRRKDGSIFWGSTSFRHLGHGGSNLVLLTTRDITAQVDAERALAASRAELSALINSTDDLIWVVAPGPFGLVIWNDAFAATIKRVLDLHVREGLEPDTLQPPEVAEAWRAFYRRALTEGPFTTEYVEQKGGRVMLLSFNTLGHDGRVTGVAVFGKDITERKHEQERRTQMELQLYEAQKMESLGSLAGGVAHDFNNMLAGIMGYADLMLADETDPHKRDDLEAILQAATRSSDLTRKLLAFGRRGKNIVEPLDLNAIVQEGVAMLRPTFSQNITVDAEVTSEATIDGDPSQLNQLVVNLCINAREAMPTGGTLTVRTADVELDAASAEALRVEPGAYVRLRVTDTGVGMSDEVKARIFEPFFTTKTRGRAAGTGLGLSTVYGIVHLHHGAITVDSVLGRGTTFTVLLPQGSLAMQAKAATQTPAAGHGLILVVEDEPLLRRFATSALRRLGYTVLTAEDGEEGVAMFRARHAELSGVLLDLKMPKKDGRETFIECRAIDPSVPVLICSGYGDNEEAQGLITLGAKGLLAKPYRVSVLGEMLAQVAAPHRP